MLSRRPDLKVVPIRGNVETRLRKLAAGEVDATMLALAGLRRLDMTDRITAVLETDIMLPAVAQGAIGIETRAGDDYTNGLLVALNCEETFIRVAAERALLAGRWQPLVGVGLHGKVLGVVGLGRIGSAVADVGRAFGMRVVSWSQNLDARAAAERGVEAVTKDELFAGSDVVTLHLRLSARTRHVVGAAELRAMRPSALLVNTARAGLLDTGALLAALDGVPGLSCHRPDGAFYAFPSVEGCLGRTTPAGARLKTDEDFALALLAEQGVAVVHGAAFGMSPHVRISFATDDAALAEACRRIGAFCASIL